MPPEQTEATVLDALAVGYRHIDTTQMYRNDAGVGAAIATSGLPREQLYITSKLGNGSHRPDDAEPPTPPTAWQSRLGPPSPKAGA